MFGFKVVSERKINKIREYAISISANGRCIKDWMDILNMDDVLIDETRRLADDSEIKANEILKILREL